jgi:hypothetical protein
MEFGHVDEAVALLEEANANLEPELLSAPVARKLIDAYARAEKLAAFGVAALARKLDDASEIARVTGTSVGRAKEKGATGKVLSDSAPLEDALKHERSLLTKQPRSTGPRSRPRGLRASC